MNSPYEGASIGPLEAFWRFRSWTVPVTIVIGVLAGLAALATSGTSTATSTLYLTDPRGTPVFRDGSTNPTDLARYARQRAEFAQSATLRATVVESLAALPSEAGRQRETVESLDDVISASTTSSSDVRVECTDPDEARALVICEQVVIAYVELTNADTQAKADSTIGALLAERDRLTAEVEGNPSGGAIGEIDLRIAEIRSEAALFGSGLEFVDPPEVADSSRLLPAVQYGIAGLLFAAFVAAAIAWFRAGRRPVVVTSADAGSLLRAPVLGELVAASSGPFEPAQPPGAAYQLLATSVGAVRPDGGVILAATARNNPDAPEAIARLAVAAAREGRGVLVVDGNLHERRLSTLFGLERGTAGLTELLAGLTGLDDVRHTFGVGGVATLDVVAGGRGVDDPASLFRSQHARSVLATLRAQYDVVLIDVPPLLTFADGPALASGTDGVVLFVERDAEKLDLDTVRQRLGVLRVPLVGIVFDRRTREHAR